MKAVKSFENCKIRVTYPDGLNEHEITFDELYERFKEEGEEWKTNFVSRLIMTGVAYTRMGATYELLEHNINS